MVMCGNVNKNEMNFSVKTNDIKINSSGVLH